MLIDWTLFIVDQRLGSHDGASATTASWDSPVLKQLAKSIAMRKHVVLTVPTISHSTLVSDLPLPPVWCKSKLFTCQIAGGLGSWSPQSPR